MHGGEPGAAGTTTGTEYGGTAGAYLTPATAGPIAGGNNGAAGSAPNGAGGCASNYQLFTSGAWPLICPPVVAAVAAAGTSGATGGNGGGILTYGSDLPTGAAGGAGGELAYLVQLMADRCPISNLRILLRWRWGRRRGRWGRNSTNWSSRGTTRRRRRWRSWHFRN